MDTKKKSIFGAMPHAASHLAFTIICSVAASEGWKVRSADASNAHLQEGGIDRLLILKPPSPAPPGTEGKLLRAKGSIYGTRDAPRAWWLYLKTLLLEEGWQEHGLEPALFFRRDCGALTGLLVTHVDDLFFAGVGAAFHEAMENLAGKVQLTYKDPPLVFCGKTIDQSEDGSMRVD